MKLYPNQLAQQLQKNLSPVYLLSGDEPLLAQEAKKYNRALLRFLGTYKNTINGDDLKLAERYSRCVSRTVL